MADVLQTCRAIADDAARLACYDRLADAADKSNTIVSVTELTPATAPPLPPPPASAPTPEELFGHDAVTSEEMMRQAAGIGRLEELDQRVTAMRRSPDGKLVLTLANGQVWAQIDSRRVRLAAGDEVRIRRAAMGSYLLAGADMTQGIRVRRIR